jgi:hypothetical protein
LKGNSPQANERYFIKSMNWKPVGYHLTKSLKFMRAYLREYLLLALFVRPSKPISSPIYHREHLIEDFKGVARL